MQAAAATAPKKKQHKVTKVVTIVTADKKSSSSSKKKKVISNRPKFLAAPGPNGETSDAFATSSRRGDDDIDDGDGGEEDDFSITDVGDPHMLAERVLNLTSYDRNTQQHPDAADCVLPIQPIQDIKDIELLHFELPHPRNTIESGYNSRFVFSEYYDGTWHVFAANIPEGTYTARTLCDMLTNCMLTAHSVNSFSNVKNTYNVSEDAVGGRIRISSASTLNNEQVPFQIHCGIGSYSDKPPSSRSRARYTAVEVKSVNAAADQVTFKVKSSAISRWGPGHLLKVATKKATVTAQVVSWTGNVLQLRAGDLSVPFAGETDATLTPITISSAHHTDPSLSQILGFETRDLYDNTLMPLVTCTNPTAIESDGLTNEVGMRIGIEFAIGMASGRFITFHNTGTFLDGEEYTIASAVGETHATITVDLTRIWNNGVILYDALGNQVFVPSTDITFLGTEDGVMNIELSSLGAHAINTGLTELYIQGFLGVNGPVEVDVDSWDGTTGVTVSFIFPWSLEIDNFPVFDYGSTSTVPAVQLINAHGINLVQVCTNRYDISASRRIVFIKMSLNNDSIPIGNIRLNESDNSNYFGRIQLDSGPLQVQFAQAEKLYGFYRLTVPTKKIENIHFEIFTEDGLHYPLNGLNWSITIRVRHRNLATLKA